MKMLIIGRNGQLARAFEALDPTLTRLGRDRLDLENTAQINDAVAAAEPDLVVNAAAYTAVDQAESEPERAQLVNGEAVGALAAAAARRGAPFIHISTDYVYAGTGERPYRETDPTEPINAYGASKLLGEERALAANPRTVILRTAWVVSPWGKNFLKTMLRLGRERDVLRIVADQHGQPTSALDLARACLAIAPTAVAADANSEIWGPTHFAGAGPTTWAEFAETIFRKAEGRLIERAPTVERIATSEFPTPAKRPANSMLDLARFEHLFGYAPRSWTEALDEILDILNPEELA